jgi:hypothetical protein
MSPEYEAAAEIRGAILALKEEFAGEPSLSESVGVIAAQLIVLTDAVNCVVIELQASNAMKGNS